MSLSNITLWRILSAKLILLMCVFVFFLIQCIFLNHKFKRIWLVTMKMFLLLPALNLLNSVKLNEINLKIIAFRSGNKWVVWRKNRFRSDLNRNFISSLGWNFSCVQNYNEMLTTQYFNKAFQFIFLFKDVGFATLIETKKQVKFWWSRLFIKITC